MPFAIAKNEKTIEELVSRLFSQDGKISKATAKQATTALLKANPQLEDMGRLPGGSLIVVPDTAPPLAPSESVKAPASAHSEAVARAQQSVDALAARLAEIDALARDATRLLAEQARTKPPRQTQEDIPDLASLLPFDVTKTKDLEANLKSSAKAVASIQDHLASLL